MNRDRLKFQLKHDEGWRASAYQDHLGFWTIGYGFLIDERRCGKLPARVAEFWLDHLLDKLTAELAVRVPCWDEQPEIVQEALANMAYQLGVNGLLKFKRMLRAVALRHYGEAARHALDSKWAEQTPNRARRVANMIRAGISA